jgi:ribonuclease-3
VRGFIRRSWGSRVSSESKAPQHPKSALLEWAAANKRRAPSYEVTDRSGPDHAPRFTVKAAIGEFAAASATGGSKQEAETAAAAALLDKLG